MDSSTAGSEGGLPAILMMYLYDTSVFVRLNLALRSRLAHNVGVQLGEFVTTLMGRYAAYFAALALNDGTAYIENI